MTYREVTRKLAALGCRELLRKGGGSNRKWHNPAVNRSTVVPDWGGRDLKTGTVRGAVRQLGIEWSAFDQAESLHTLNQPCAADFAGVFPIALVHPVKKDVGSSVALRLCCQS